MNHRMTISQENLSRRNQLLQVSMCFITCIATLPSCSSNQHANRNAHHLEYHPGVVEGDPQMSSLPSINIHPKDLTEKMRFGLLLAEQSFEVAPPSPPVDPTLEKLQAWVSSGLPTWISRKSQLVEAAHAELDIAAEENSKQRIMAGAIVGLMYESTWKVFAGIPIPQEFAQEQDIAKIYDEVMEQQASPFIGFAHKAYHACAENAFRLRTLKHWYEFCSGKSELLLSLQNKKGEDKTQIVSSK